MTIILSDEEITTYLETLDIEANTDIKLALASLTPLSLPLFREVLSGLAGGSIFLSDILALPTVSDFTIRKLLSVKLASDSAFVIANNYRNVVLPNYTNLNAIKAQAIGDIRVHIKKLLTKHFYVITPKYNYVVSEDVGFYDFDDILEFYTAAANSDEVLQHIANFANFANASEITHPNIVPAPLSACNIFKLIQSVTTQPYFLEIRGTAFANNQTETLHWIMNERYTSVSPENFNLVMEENYKIMAEHNAEDITKYGETGRIILDKLSTNWQGVIDRKVSTSVDRVRINTYYLPMLYGETDLVELAKADFDFINTYLTEARKTLVAIHSVINRKFTEFYAGQGL